MGIIDKGGVRRDATLCVVMMSPETQIFFCLTERSCYKEYTCTMKALCLPVQKLQPRLSFSKILVGNRSQVKVKNKNIVLSKGITCNRHERSIDMAKVQFLWTNKYTD